MPEFDVIAIGGGAAGPALAIGGAGLGVRVALVERHRTSGECSRTGCVPSKALLHIAGPAAAREAATLSVGGVAGPEIDSRKVIARARAARRGIGEEESPAAQGLRRTALAVWCRIGPSSGVPGE